MRQTSVDEKEDVHYIPIIKWREINQSINQSINK
jgi:hypothetical protein